MELESGSFLYVGVRVEVEAAKIRSSPGSKFEFICLFVYLFIYSKTFTSKTPPIRYG